MTSLSVAATACKDDKYRFVFKKKGAHEVWDEALVGQANFSELVWFC